MLDARGVQRLLERVLGLAETSALVGDKTVEGVRRDSRLSEETRERMAQLYRREARERTRSYARLGLALCEALGPELADEGARLELQRFFEAFVQIEAVSLEPSGEN